MKLNRVEVEGFRGLEKEEFQLDDLTVFSGEMGTGKTSRLLAILYNLTGSAPSGINLDEMINVNSDYMWVKTEGEIDGKSFTVERSKRRERSTTLKTDLEELPKLSENIFIEGREIATLFLGAPTEKTFRIDTLLGLSRYNQAASEISTAYIERRIEDLKKIREELNQASTVKESLVRAEEELKRVSEERSKVSEELKTEAEKYAWAEETTGRAEESSRKNVEIQSKQSLVKDYEDQIASLPKSSPELEETVNELKARYDASQKRVAFLEAVMQILDLEGRKLDEIPTCPVCGALISTDALEKFRHYDEEYRRIIGEVTQLEVELGSKRETLEKARQSREKIQMLQSQVKRLKDEISSISITAVPTEELKNAEEALNRRGQLTQKARELDIRRSGLEEQVTTYRSLYGRIEQVTVKEVDSKMAKLTELKDRLQRIKTTLIDTLSEARVSQLDSLRASFKETFRRIYPYERLKDVDFETTQIRGREIIQVKGRVNDRWIHPNQMSTGENVAISFALLFAANQLETAPILLLDEPEEGLDENGIQGLADILKNLKQSTQLIVATRNPRLTQLLQPEEVAA
ncbi:MAG: AAA family ATPase [Nitrososphaerales archaeon]